MKNDSAGVTPKVDRRAFLTAAGVGLAASVADPAGAVRTIANGNRQWDSEADVVVIGSGCAAGAAAAAALKAGRSVLIVEKAPVWGGTTAKSGAAYWVCNNSFMRRAGMKDDREDALRLMVRAGFPERYRADQERFGIDARDYDLLATFYDRGAEIVDILDNIGAIKSEWIVDKQGQPAYFDYTGTLAENKVPLGRALVHAKGPDGRSPAAEMANRLRSYATRGGAKILLRHSAVAVLTNASGDVVGVDVKDAAGAVKSIRARRGVIFGSGGFTHNEAFAEAYLRGAIHGGCAVPTNQGDIIPIATALGAELGNMTNAWWGQVVIEQALQTRSLGALVFLIPGLSMMVVNKTGRRVCDEFMVYNERTQVHFQHDPDNFEPQNRVLFMVFDEATRTENGGWYPIPPANGTAPYMLRAETIEELGVVIQRRLDELAPRIGAIKLDRNFVSTFEQTKKRYAGFAARGIDDDFRRGSNVMGRLFSMGRIMADEVFANSNLSSESTSNKWTVDPDGPNDSMRALNDRGPYYAILLGAGTLDTKGGPRINTSAQIVKERNEPIRGLYGAGNCISSPAGQGYFAGGVTIALGLTYGYIAGEHAARSPVIEI